MLQHLCCLAQVCLALAVLEAPARPGAERPPRPATAAQAPDWQGFLDQASLARQSCVVLCGARPGNVGSTLRVCALLGLPFLVVIGLSRDKCKKAVELSQLGEDPGVSLVKPPLSLEVHEVLQRLRATGLSLLGLTAHSAGGKAKPVWNLKLTCPGVAFVFGREHDGIPPNAEMLLDEAATIPMVVDGEKGSLNVSHAAALVLYERRRNFAAAVDTGMPPKKKAADEAGGSPLKKAKKGKAAVWEWKDGSSWKAYADEDDRPTAYLLVPAHFDVPAKLEEPTPWQAERKHPVLSKCRACFHRPWHFVDMCVCVCLCFCRPGRRIHNCPDPGAWVEPGKMRLLHTFRSC
ncbi:unnamed protein product [Symbiodinium necroappetens]|uniref:tRNA/rRNA methyltransferase SpoU type domain-containing protein n=1 Tax=Symbiodinium necroappetens TaxID=1628268 RepID=A0A812QUM6_9DINO|nr:unnamed protein product [Symbiodinium necroappetens]